jgi:hypothetical protein
MEGWPKKWNAGLMEVERKALKTEGGKVSWRKVKNLKKQVLD